MSSNLVRSAVTLVGNSQVSVSSLPAPSSNATGTAAAVDTNLVSAELTDARFVSFQITGTFVASVQFQVSNNNTDWTPQEVTEFNGSTMSMTDTVTAAGFFAVNAKGRYYRIRTTAYTSGTVNADVFLYETEVSTSGGAGDASASNQLTQINRLEAIRDRLPSSLGSLTAANSLSVTMAGDDAQAADISSINTKLTDGSQKSIVRGGAKGTTTETDVTSTASGADHQGLDVIIYDTSGNAITSFGGGTEYADGATAATPTGTQVNWNESGTQRSVSLSQALPVQPGTGSTFPISAASLPLPTGAATEAKQPALGTAGTASADVITVQGIASMTALVVDGSAVTQPISATALPLPTGAATETTLSSIDTKLTDGTQKSIVRGGAKGTTTETDVTSTASGANHQGLDVIIYDTSGNPITSFGGGTEYADGATAVTPTGTQINWNESGTQRSVSLTQALPVQPGTGSTFPISAASLPLPTGAATETTLSSIDTKLAESKIDTKQVVEQISGFAQTLSAPGASTVIDSTPYSRIIIWYDVANIGTSVTIRVEGSGDGTTWVNLDAFKEDTTITENTAHYFILDNVPAYRVRFNFVSEAGGTNATIGLTATGS